MIGNERSLEMIKVLVPIRTVSELNARTHWSVRARRAKVHRTSTRWALMACGPGQLPCKVTLTRIGRRDMDGDNLQGSLKAARDGVADWLRASDSDPRITWVYAQRRADRGGILGVEIQVEMVSVRSGEDDWREHS